MTIKGNTRGDSISISSRRRQSFQAYVELMDAADWLAAQLRHQLTAFDLTINGFRILEMLQRDGPMTTDKIREWKKCSRQGAMHLIRPLEEKGWVRSDVVMLAPVEMDEKQLSRDKRGRRRRGRKIGQVTLTASGKKFIGEIFPRHAKLVFAFMRALEGREQQSLILGCRKLMRGNNEKFMREFMLED